VDGRALAAATVIKQALPLGTEAMSAAAAADNQGGPHGLGDTKQSMGCEVVGSKQSMGCVSSGGHDGKTEAFSCETRLEIEAAHRVCTYLRLEFLGHLNASPRVIVEVGARDLLDSVCLALHFPSARVLSFECHPELVGKCQSRHDALPSSVRKRIDFVPAGLGSAAVNVAFHPYVCDNPGASSVFWRVDGKETQVTSPETIAIRRLNDELVRVGLGGGVDLLCMDVQGYELEVLKGVDCSLVKHVIMEEPNGSFHSGPSHYVGAPSRQEIAAFMKNQGFTEVARSRENDWEDNVMYTRTQPP
jgi:FkbM family methyltransferase